MVTMDMLEQDNYYDTTPTTTLLIPSSPSGRSFLFLDEAASSKLNLHGGFFRKSGHLGLFEAKHTYVIHGFTRYSYVVFRSKRVDRCV